MKQSLYIDFELAKNTKEYANARGSTFQRRFFRPLPGIEILLDF